MIQLNTAQFAEWVGRQAWISLPDPSSWRFTVRTGEGVRSYECKIAEDSALVGCNMARIFLGDIKSPQFPGGLFWIVRTFPDDPDIAFFTRQVLRGCGISDIVDIGNGFTFFLLGRNEFDTCFTLVALALMFGWDANFVCEGRRFLLEMDDEPFPRLITDSISQEFENVTKSLEFRITDLAQKKS